MIPLYRDPYFKFEFQEPRRVSRFHLYGVAEGASVAVYRFDSATQTREAQLAEAVVGAGGWVQLAEELQVDENSGFVVVVNERKDNAGDRT